MKRRRGQVLKLLLVAVMLTAALVAAATAHAAGTGPEAALTPDGDWAEMAAGESRWYAFQYAGDGSQIQVRLQAVPEGSATFAVWTPDQVWHWGLGERVEPVGRGSVEGSAGGILVWSGSFPVPGTYYVVVEAERGQPGRSYYLLEVKGDGVSLSERAAASTPAATTAAASSRAQSKPAAASGLTGKLVFQTAYGGDFYTINADGSGLQCITSGTDPVWSPDGSQIAFTRWQEPRGVWVVDADGSNERRVFDWPRETSYPSWSPDGAQIVFARQHRGRLEEVERCVVHGSKLFCFTIPPNPHYNLGVVGVNDGSFWEPLPSGSERSLAPDWSPVGEEVVYADVHGLFVQSADGQARYQLTNNNKDINPVWSPDGEQVAFTRRQHDHWEIYVVDADGGNLKRLTTTPALPNGTVGNSVSPAWSPGGQSIAFLTDRTGEWEIWVMEANGSNQRSMFGAALNGLTLEYAFQGERGISWTQ